MAYENPYPELPTNGLLDNYSGSNIAGTIYNPSIPQNQPDDPLSVLIINSKIYKDAYALFSSDLRYGKPYLDELVMIPYKYRVRDETFWDEAAEFLGMSSDYESLINDSFNSAMDEIIKLARSYNDFINTLPREQVSQFAEAGINSSVTGQGIAESSRDSSAIQSEPISAQNYNGQAISTGITSFVDFIGAMNAITNTGVNSASLLGMLDIAEREGYNKQELHDLIMSQSGVISSSPYRVLGASGVLVSNAESAVADSKLKAAKSSAAASFLDKKISVPVGNDPNQIQDYEIMTGKVVLNEMTKLKMTLDWCDTLGMYLRGQNNLLYADTLSILENQFNEANLNAGIKQAGFNQQYFANRNGATEGKAQTSTIENISFIRANERFMKDFEKGIAEYKYNQLQDWANRVGESPSLAPFLYKAIFDFGMEDTFYHQSPWTQGLKYGVDNVSKICNIITGFMGKGAVKLPEIKYPKSSTSYSY